MPTHLPGSSSRPDAADFSEQHPEIFQRVPRLDMFRGSLFAGDVLDPAVITVIRDMIFAALQPENVGHNVAALKNPPRVHSTRHPPSPPNARRRSIEKRVRASHT